MTKFDDNLWREIERSYGSKLSGSQGPLRRGPRIRVPVLAGTGLGVAGASVAAVIVLGAAGSAPAYAVTRHSDGSVSVTIRRIDGIRGANQRLAQLGIRARAVQIAGGCQATVSPALRKVTIATFVRVHRVVRLSGSDGAAWTRIRPAQIPSHRILVIPVFRSGTLVRVVHGRVVRGTVPNCLPPAAMLRSASRGARVQILRCGPAVQLHQSPTAAGTSTVTDSGSATGSTTTTNPGTATVSSPPTTETATVVSPPTSTGTSTVSSTATGSGTGTQVTAAGPPNFAPPPIFQACLRAARQSTR